MGVILHIVGMPGHIEDTATWLRWFEVIAPSIWFLVFIGVVVSGPLLWTSGWWWPRFKKLIRRDNGQRLEQLEAEKAYHDFRHTSAGVKQSLLEARLTELEDRLDMGKSGQLENILPHIQKCRELLTPSAMPLATIGIGKTDWLGVQKVQFVELVSELGYLARRLDIMGIQSPNLTVEEDATYGDFNIFIQHWKWYLARLEEAIQQGNFEGARLLVSKSVSKKGVGGAKHKSLLGNEVRPSNSRPFGFTQGDMERSG